MQTGKYYCLKCNQTNACKCGNTENQFSFSHKLRPPKDLKNKMEWRKFIKDCPQFINMVPVKLYPKFKDLLENIKYPDNKINGRNWKNWDERTINKLIKEKTEEINKLLLKAGFKLESNELNKLVEDVNFNLDRVEFELFKSGENWFINNYKHENIDKNLKFIENLKKNGLNEDDEYSSIIDKYTNGECEALVSYLYQINNNSGEEIEIHQNIDGEDLYHYVFKINNKYYDINGKHNDIYSIMKNINYFDEHSCYDERKVDKIYKIKLPKLKELEKKDNKEINDLTF